MPAAPGPAAVPAAVPSAVPDLPRSARQVHLDWLRGLAVVIMITAHAADSWTAPDQRERPVFRWTLVAGGGGSALFLFLAGVAATLAAETRARRLGDARAAAVSVQRRGWQIFLYAFLFRLQSFVLSPGAPLVSLLRVDVLNVMGPSIAAAAALWQTVRGAAARASVLCGVTAAIAFATPLVRTASWPASLPDPLEWYLRPSPGHTNFTLLPWAGFVTGGAVVGLWLHRARERRVERRAHAALALAGLALAAAGWAGSHLPSPYASSSFWTSSPAFFGLRLGLLAVSVSAAFAWTHRTVEPPGRGPLYRLGLSSLFVYWIHVELVFGAMTAPLHRRLPLPWVYIAIGGFILLMLGAVHVKERVVSWWRGRHAGGRANPTS